MPSLRLGVVAACILVQAACGGSAEPAAPEAAPNSAPSAPTTVSESQADRRTITAGDDESVVTMAIGDGAELVIRDPHAPDPVLTGTAIRLIEISNITASGLREWDIETVHRGRADLRASEDGKPFVVHFAVQ